MSACVIIITALFFCCMKTEMLLSMQFPIDLEQHDRREQLKKSGLGKVIMFLSKSDEETTSNRKLAKELVDKWSRPIFNKSTRFEDMRNVEDDRVPLRRPSVKRPTNRAASMESRDGDFDLDISRDHKSGRSLSGQNASRSESSSRLHASRPDATPMDFVVRPQSKIDPDEIRARAKQVVQDQRRLKMNKKLQQLKAPKKKQLQASKLSVEGRGMLKYLLQCCFSNASSNEIEDIIGQCFQMKVLQHMLAHRNNFDDHLNLDNLFHFLFFFCRLLLEVDGRAGKDAGIPTNFLPFLEIHFNGILLTTMPISFELFSSTSCLI
ncbi:signal recognition particle receptor subunit beta-like isoform X1 [Gossypium australe]|uniref:Signal recognition particle receptor subunit beta-like isoform X1 n=1 Tax=Gossypium australe TaxID=47621 RepID=A0A5B6UJK3_9ROSI|nr:signal recognition particle receptor subunit beta-like isoform X1 [Gossypium australe]